MKKWIALVLWMMCMIQIMTPTNTYAESNIYSEVTLAFQDLPLDMYRYISISSDGWEIDVDAARKENVVNESIEKGVIFVMLSNELLDELKKEYRDYSIQGSD